MEIFLFMAAPFLILLIYTFFSAIYIFLKDFNNPNHVISRKRLIISEFVFIYIGPLIGFSRYDDHDPEMPFAQEHVLSIVLISAVSIFCYFLSRIFENKLSLIQKGILSVGILQGIILCFFTSIHFIYYLPQGIFFPFFGFELATPYIGFLLLSIQFYFLNKKNSTHTINEIKKLKSPYFPQLKKLLIIYRFQIYPLLLGILLALEIIVLLFLGEEVDGILKAFYLSNGFFFSNIHIQTY